MGPVRHCGVGWARRGPLFYSSPVVAKIEEFLTGQLSEDAEMASALLIHTVNKDAEKVCTTFECVERS